MNLSSTTPGPTRNDAYLDVCLTNKPDLFQNIYVDGSLFNSDHDALIFDLSFPIIKKEVKPIKYRKYNKANTSLLNRFLSSIIPIISTQNYYLEDKYNHFIDNILASLNLYVPEKLVTKKDLRHNYPAHLKASIKKKAEIYRQLKTDKLKYKELYDSISLHIKIQTRNFHNKKQNAFITKNRDSIHKYLKKFKYTNNEIPVLYYNNSYITKSIDKSEIFADIFLENFSNTNMQYSHNNNENNQIPIIEDVDFDIIDIISFIKKLPNRNGTSPDNINYKILKIVLPSIAPFLSEIFRISLDSGILPDIWKESIIIPLFKKGEKSNPENYRPIALTCAICRVMEMVLNKYIVQFLLDNNLFSKDQYGFIKNRSTTTQLITTLEDWYDAIMGKKNIDCIYIDFKKAFDSVPHDLLINKLYRIGIRGKF
uniref:Reverse transcriptase domain-containing protein n=1 Tax=Meloidogyne enterolobii TaxID=390850 RepID=A0A6V7Y7P9_MELEN|nr:unnamed protein product [Meloidogyne enterolobii]CAD2207719.1 unnamed protein product [Meloidogyne enterolobii]